MKKIKMYQVDAFTENVFGGNPAAVCVLDEWFDEETMQNIASENNLAETAFVVRNKDDFEIRWFTPKVEVDLCGHATLASAHTTLTPFWSKRLGKKKLTAKQLSERQGNLECELDGDRVKISGKAVTYLIGEIFIP